MSVSALALEAAGTPAGLQVGTHADVRARLLAAARSDRLDQLLADAFAVGALPIATRRALRAHAEAKLRGMAQVAHALADPDDHEELLAAVAALWLELRFEWERHNRVANFATVRTGTADPAVLAAAGICSGLLAWVEAILPDATRDRLLLLASTLRDVGRHEDADASRVERASPGSAFARGAGRS